MLTNNARANRRRSSMAAAAMCAELLARKPGAAAVGASTPTRHHQRLTNVAENELLESRCADDDVSMEFDCAASDTPSSAAAPAPLRRRAVDTSDLRSCALVQTRLKQMKTVPEYR